MKCGSERGRLRKIPAPADLPPVQDCGPGRRLPARRSVRPGVTIRTEPPGFRAPGFRADVSLDKPWSVAGRRPPKRSGAAAALRAATPLACKTMPVCRNVPRRGWMPSSGLHAPAVGPPGCRFPPLHIPAPGEWPSRTAERVPPARRGKARPGRLVGGQRRGHTRDDAALVTGVPRIERMSPA